MVLMSDSLATWLNAQVKEKGWSLRETGRRAGVSHTTIVKIANGMIDPTIAQCRSLARAFGMPLEDIFQIAGVLQPPLRARRLRSVRSPKVNYQLGNQPEQDLVTEMMDRFERLSPAAQELVAGLVEMLSEVPPPRIIGDAPEDTGD